MPSQSAPAVDMRLMVAASLKARLEALDDAQYAAFQDAVAFAQLAIGRALAAAEMPKFMIVHGDLALTVSFDRWQERFVIVDFDESDGDPPGGGHPLSAVRYTLAEGVLGALSALGEQIPGLQVLRPGRGAPSVSNSIRMSAHELELLTATAQRRDHRYANGTLVLIAAAVHDARASEGEAFGMRVSQGTAAVTASQTQGSGAPNSSSTDS